MRGWGGDGLFPQSGRPSIREFVETLDNICRETRPQPLGFTGQCISYGPAVALRRDRAAALLVEQSAKAAPQLRPQNPHNQFATNRRTRNRDCTAISAAVYLDGVSRLIILDVDRNSFV
jgi:hypothetical protein